MESLIQLCHAGPLYILRGKYQFGICSSHGCRFILFCDIFQFGGNDILQIYNVHQVKHRLNTTGMYIASTKVRENLLFYHFMKIADTIINLISGPRCEKGADQSSHSLILISTFVINILESIISKLATSEISTF